MFRMTSHLKIVNLSYCLPCPLQASTLEVISKLIVSSVTFHLVVLLSEAPSLAQVFQPGMCDGETCAFNITTPIFFCSYSYHQLTILQNKSPFASC